MTFSCCWGETLSKTDNLHFYKNFFFFWGGGVGVNSLGRIMVPTAETAKNLLELLRKGEFIKLRIR